MGPDERTRTHLSLSRTSERRDSDHFDGICPDTGSRAATEPDRRPDCARRSHVWRAAPWPQSPSHRPHPRTPRSLQRQLGSASTPRRSVGASLTGASPPTASDRISSGWTPARSTRSCARSPARDGPPDARRPRGRLRRRAAGQPEPDAPSAASRAGRADVDAPRDRLPRPHRGSCSAQRRPPSGQAMNEKSHPRQGGQSSSSVTSRPDYCTPQVRQSPALHAVAHVIVVTSGRCVERSDLYWRCSVCGKTHASRARGDLPATIRRRGPHGPVVLHLVSIATEVAA